MRKICVFTSSRADFGQLNGLLQLIRASPSATLQLLASGTHLAPEFGCTIREIERLGYAVNERVEMVLPGDSATTICKSMGLALNGYGEALTRLQPDVLVVLGDRYETFCAAAAAQVCRIPLAHLHGGETTEGAMDEAFRHSITKMAHLHFPACEEYRRRIIQLGEDPTRVFNVGALAIENIRKIKLLSLKELEDALGFAMDRPFFLVTLHPVTLENATAGGQFDALWQALAQFPEHRIVFTKANADADGRIINQKIDALAGAYPRRVLAVSSLGMIRYLSVLKLADAMLGNSSSGLLEAPVMEVPTVNIGDRQKGRLRTASVVDCAADAKAIAGAIRSVLDPTFRTRLQGLRHPCERADTARNIFQTLCRVDLSHVLKKSFYNLPLTVFNDEPFSQAPA